MKTKPENEPLLRFQEFVKDANDKFRIMKLSELSLEVLSGGTPSTQNNSYWIGNIPWISSGDITEENMAIPKKFITKEAISESPTNLIPRDNLIVVTRVGLGKLWQNQIDVCISQDCQGIVVNKNLVTPMYLTKVLSIVVKEFISNSQGSTIQGITKAYLLEIPIPLPSLPEQQKIAACLTSLDDHIQAQTQKLEAYKTHKTALLQQLFPHGDALIPPLRFLEFSGDVEWRNKAFSDVFQFISTNSLSRDKLTYEFGNIKNIHYGDIHTKLPSHIDVELEELPFIKKEFTQSKLSADSLCKVGDLIIADASEDLEDIGKSIEIVNINNSKIVSGLHTIHARQKENTFMIGFVGHLFKSPFIRIQIQRESQGTKVLGLSVLRLSDMIIPIPSLPEQQKIADCLTSLDDLIQAQTQKIDLLKQHKTALMQNLFPKVQ